MSCRLAILLAVLVLLAACAAAPGPEYLKPPLLRVEARCFAGTPLVQRIDSAEPWPADPEQAYEVELRLHYLEHLPETVLHPLSQRLALVFADRDREPVRPASLIASSSRTDCGAEAALWLEHEFPKMRSVKMADLRAALPPGVTCEFSGTVVPMLGSRDAVHVQLRIRVGRAHGEDGAVSVAVLIEDLTADPERARSASGLELPERILEAEPDPLEEDAANEKLLYRELLLLADRPVPDADPLVVLFPTPFAGYDGALLVDIAIRTGAKAGSGHADRLELSRQQVAAAAEELRKHLRVADSADLEALAVATTWGALRDTPTRRPGLAWLARISGAPLAGELALVADESVLGKWWQRLEVHATPDSPSAAGWMLERTAYEVVLEIRNEGDLPLAVEGALAQHAGAAGRIAAILEDALAASENLEDFRRELLVDNLILLKDSDPAARLRAHDWLQARGAAPEGFDPLGTQQERRTALAAFLPRILELMEIEQ